MDKVRAKEIASSTIMADVTHNGTRIYIESVDDNKETAKIHPLNNPKSEQEVSLTDLMEH
ncbi:H-type small acid-soluble spore protein [Clostridium sp. OS1-26]|uniref:H-type small acid-soluble spore protein n=1 Tax=Clostridium sp. OS1-26 TaxID=3070681 RepID=UPI0027E10EE6|nr:H-type small acid-soluble spore protein [Clostridium sp. OS1-26]WML34831.1 H-type small acid-soluble spore protein [Clostridium sp. OS1-26]